MTDDRCDVRRCAAAMAPRLAATRAAVAMPVLAAARVVALALGAACVPAASAAAVALPAAWAIAGVQAAGLPSSEPKLLPPEDAFRFSARALDDHTLEARFDVADGYYLYRDKLGFTVEPSGTTAGTPALPQGTRKHDAFFGDVETYRGRVVVRLPIGAARPGQELVLKADSQGCADAGICYPPTVQQVKLAVPAAGKGPGPIVEPARRKAWFN